MRTKSALVVLLLSIFCLGSQVTFADSLQFTGVGGASAAGVYTYPYYFTVSGPGGDQTLVSMSCLNFDREIAFNEKWTVNPYNVLSIPTGELDGFTQDQFRADALLFNQYAAATDPMLISELQYAIWNIMDPSVINASNNSYNGLGAFDAKAQQLASDANANEASADPSNFANIDVFMPDLTDSTGWTNGKPQIFMVDPAPAAITPEPSSLLLLGTGLLGTVLVMRRKLVKA